MIRQYVDVLFMDGELMLTDAFRLYKGDSGILVSVKVEKQYYRNNKLVSENVIELGKYGRAIIRKAQIECQEDDGIEDPVYCSDVAKIEEGRLDILIPAEAIDETSEMGIYQIQIQLYGDNEINGRPRLTLDPFEFEACNLISEDMELEEPEFDVEAGSRAIVDEGEVDKAELLNDGEELPVEDEEGNYNKTIWQKGQIIWANQLNKIENALNHLFIMIGAKVSKGEMYMYVDEKIGEIDIPEVDLSGCAPIDHTHDEYLTEIPSDYINEEELEAKGYLTEHQDLSNYATKEEIPSIDGLASEAYVNEQLGDIESILRSINGEEI